MVGAWAAENALMLGQVKVDDNSNEISAIPKLLQVLDVAGCIVTIDAVGCQYRCDQRYRHCRADHRPAGRLPPGTAVSWP
jgi:predicted transposase YbfD/YdcC